MSTIMLKSVRLSFPQIWTPKAYLEGQTPKFSANFLLDKDQPVPWAHVQEYHLKYRFYFRMYDPATVQPLVRLYHQTEAFAGEYDVMRCKPGMSVAWLYCPCANAELNGRNSCCFAK